MAFRIIQGNCKDVLKQFPDNHFDGIVTDPPYELGFMGKSWDSTGIAYDVDMWREAMRVVKPGGYLLSFSGSRTYHRIACAIEDAGWEIRDQIMWIYGSGFPKSRDIGKDMDKIAGATRQAVGLKYVGCGNRKGEGFRHAGSTAGVPVTAPESENAKQWDGWGTALKPAHEPIVVARKPLAEKTVAQNVLKHGTGAINIDACRVPPASDADAKDYSEKCASVVGLDSNCTGDTYGEWNGARTDSASPLGRWPANIIHDGSDEVLAAFPDSDGAGGSVPNVKVTGYGSGIGTGESQYLGGERVPFESGSGSAARFFYCAKASHQDREEGLDELNAKLFGMSSAAAAAAAAARGESYDNGDGGVNRTTLRRNFHPTVKPTALMRWLCRLVIPPGGKLIDICCGSGSTGKGAILEGFDFTGIELDRDENDQPIGYIDIANARCEWAEREYAESTRQGALDLGAAA